MLCEQCGSTSFKKQDDHNYKCEYCGSIIEEKNEINPFAAFGDFSTINTTTKIMVNGKEVNMDDLTEEQKKKVQNAMDIANKFKKGV